MPNYWKIAPGKQAQFWRDCVEKRCIPINWLNQSDLSALSIDQIESHLADHDQGAANSARSVHAFVHDIQPGDRVFANAGKSSCKRIIELRCQETNDLETHASVQFLRQCLR